MPNTHFLKKWYWSKCVCKMHVLNKINVKNRLCVSGRINKPNVCYFRIMHNTLSALQLKPMNNASSSSLDMLDGTEAQLSYIWDTNVYHDGMRTCNKKINSNYVKVLIPMMSDQSSWFLNVLATHWIELTLEFKTISHLIELDLNS